MKKSDQKKVIVAKVKGGTLTKYFLDTFIANKISSLTECNARDASKLMNPWLNNFILNRAFRVELPEITTKYVFNFLRRAEGTFIAYKNAQTALEDYINTKRNNPELNRISPYFRSLLYFEIFIAQAYQAYLFLESLVKENLKDKSEARKYEKIHELLKRYDPNMSKIYDKIGQLYLDSRKMNQKIEQRNFPQKATVGVWITNYGLESKNAKVTFDEIYEFLSYTANLASKISSLEKNR